MKTRKVGMKTGDPLTDALEALSLKRLSDQNGLVCKSGARRDARRMSYDPSRRLSMQQPGAVNGRSSTSAFSPGRLAPVTNLTRNPQHHLLAAQQHQHSQINACHAFLPKYSCLPNETLCVSAAPLMNPVLNGCIQMTNYARPYQELLSQKANTLDSIHPSNPFMRPRSTSPPSRRLGAPLPLRGAQGQPIGRDYGPKVVPWLYYNHGQDTVVHRSNLAANTHNDVASSEASKCTNSSVSMATATAEVNPELAQGSTERAVDISGDAAAQKNHSAASKITDENNNHAIAVTSGVKGATEGNAMNSNFVPVNLEAPAKHRHLRPVQVHTSGKSGGNFFRSVRTCSLDKTDPDHAGRSRPSSASSMGSLRRQQARSQHENHINYGDHQPQHKSRQHRVGGTASPKEVQQSSKPTSGVEEIKNFHKVHGPTVTENNKFDVEALRKLWYAPPSPRTNVNGKRRSGTPPPKKNIYQEWNKDLSARSELQPKTRLGSLSPTPAARYLAGSVQEQLRKTQREQGVGLAQETKARRALGGADEDRDSSCSSSFDDNAEEVTDDDVTDGEDEGVDVQSDTGDTLPTGDRLPADGKSDSASAQSGEESDTESPFSPTTTDSLQSSSFHSRQPPRRYIQQQAKARGRCQDTAALRDKNQEQQQPEKHQLLRQKPSEVKSGEPQVLSPMLPSPFPNMPPTIHFTTQDNKIKSLPVSLRKVLKWKLSAITPIIVRTTVMRSGFRLLKDEDSEDWLGIWGKHMRGQGFHNVRPYQKVNHFPGTFQLGRKDRLWRNLSRYQAKFGKIEYGFFPLTFVMPSDAKLFKKHWEEGGCRHKWIMKPPASARGIGIRVVNKWHLIPKKRPIIVQRYISRPYLINEAKFDIRLYVYVTSFDPLRVYLFDDGLARFASCKYSTSSRYINNKYIHLTNYSINKKNHDYETNGDELACKGHKWTVKALMNYLRSKGVNTTAVWQDVQDIVVKTLIATESSINSQVKLNVRSRYSVHELFGFDIMFDEDLRPWILEVNISPSLHSNSPLDVGVKGQMVADLLNIAGFHLPKLGATGGPGGSAGSGCGSSTQLADHWASHVAKTLKTSPGVIDHRHYANSLTAEEREKHMHFLAASDRSGSPMRERRANASRHRDAFSSANGILENLTPDDVRTLVDYIGENSRRGRFICVFPNASSSKYLRYFEAKRYYNLLLVAWCKRYATDSRPGVELLRRLCSKQLHISPSVHSCSSSASLASRGSAGDRSRPKSHDSHDHTRSKSTPAVGSAGDSGRQATRDQSARGSDSRHGNQEPSYSSYVCSSSSAASTETTS